MNEPTHQEGVSCDINVKTRARCPFCRYQKCLQVGMKPYLVMTEEDKKERIQKRRRREEQATISRTKYEEKRR